MIQQIRVQNFQPHDRFKVDLEPITSVIGPSDAGKSSLIRALKWLVTNTPGGDQFIQDGAKGCTVILKLDDHEIRRRRGSTKNEYILDGKVFKAFGSGVPEPIKNVLKLDQLNFQNQHDSPFWFSETAGQVSRNLNAIVDLDLIDRCLSSINKKVNRARIELDIAQDRTAESLERKKKLSWTVNASEEFKHVEQLESKVEEVKKVYEQLYQETIQAIDSFEESQQARLQLKSLENVVKLGTEIIEIRNSHDEIENLVSEIVKLREVKPPNTEKLDRLATQCREYVDSSENIRDLLQTIEQSQSKLEQLEEEVNKAEEEILEVTENVCPVCGGQLGDV